MVAWYQSKVLNSDEDIIFHLLFCTTSSQDLNKKRPTNLSTSSYMFFDCVFWRARGSQLGPLQQLGFWEAPVDNKGSYCYSVYDLGNAASRDIFII